MLSRNSTLSFSLIAGLFLSATQTFADCAPPANPGVRICSPTQNGTVVYGIVVEGVLDVFPFIDFNSTPAAGAHIVKVKAYDNNRKFFEGEDLQSGATLNNEQTDTLLNGFHNLAINAWDSQGNLYQARVSFWVVGDGFPFSCSGPTPPGINFCSPPSNSILSTRIPIVATASGQNNSIPRAMRLYIDDKEQFTLDNTDRLTVPAKTDSQGNHSFVIVAWDIFGNTLVSGRTLKSSYTYDWQRCSPQGSPCLPGIGIQPQPARNEYVGNSFTIEASVEDNPLPITAMRAYIGNTVVASSNGPTILMPVENIPSGTQALTLQAWDTSGALYRVRYSINVNVPH